MWVGPVGRLPLRDLHFEDLPEAKPTPRAPAGDATSPATRARRWPNKQRRAQISTSDGEGRAKARNKWRTQRGLGYPRPREARRVGGDQPGSQTVSHGERAEDRVGAGSICGACCRGGRACRRGAVRAERADESVHVVAAAACRVLQCVEMTALMPAVPTPPGVLAAALGTSRCVTHMQPPEVLTPGRLSRLWWTRVGPHRSCAPHHTARHA